MRINALLLPLRKLAEGAEFSHANHRFRVLSQAPGPGPFDMGEPFITYVERCDNGYRTNLSGKTLVIPEMME